MMHGIQKITAIVVFIMVTIPSFAWAVCSKVSIEIPQELTLERIAFDAKMVITNNVPDKDLTNVRIDVTIRDAAGNVKNDIFFMKVSSMKNISSVAGSGTVRAASTSEIHWLIIPSPGAGGTDPAGVPYWVGATLTYTVDGKDEVVSVNPDRIIVKPEAQLILDYFMPYEVIADNPFTPAVEAPVPFPLAVRVMNSGYGPASKLKIDSAQPKIVDNAQGLLVDFKLLGASVNGSAVSPSLVVDLGTLGSKKISTAYWEMISTLSGKFIEFDVKFSHSSELGGELTSLIKQTNAYYLVHMAKVNLPGRDGRLDFLADIDKDPQHLPDAILESEIPGDSGNPDDARSPVTVVAVEQTPSRPTTQTPVVKLRLAAGDTGWVYAKTDDPSMGLLRLLDVLRSDGVHLDPNNFWIGEELDSNHQRKFSMHLLDYRSDAGVTGQYDLVFEKPANDTIPPSTRLTFTGPSNGTDPVYITPETMIVFIASDNDGGSGVGSMLRRVVGEDSGFVAAYPMYIAKTGAAELEYYSIDRAGNSEAVKTTYLYIDNNAPTIDSYQPVPSSFTPHAPRGMSAVRSMNFAVKATDESNNLKATIDIASGVVFSESKIVNTLQTSIVSGVETKMPWDGKDKGGALVPTGVYTARVRVTDGLDGGTKSHTASAETKVTVSEWFRGEPLDPNPSAVQMHPAVSNTMVVWQDSRNGNQDIYTKDLTGGVSSRITFNSSDHLNPAISGNIVVWQDNRNGNWDIYGYDLSTGQEFLICNDPGNQERPVISGEWVAWQDDRAGNWDIYAYNISTQERVSITSHERDQMHPIISGNTLTWEDYRYGLGEIYTYDLASRTEQRYTNNIYNQTLPVVSGNTLAWTDQRSGQRDIYFSNPSSTEVRVTYGKGDHSQAAVLNDLIVYTDYETSMDDPNLAFFDIKSGIGALLTADPARQEEAALGTDAIVWQDDRDGVFQIYWALFHVEALPIEAEIKEGFNLIAVGDRLARRYPTVADMISAQPNGLVIEKVVSFNSLNGIIEESSASGAIPLLKGMGIVIYASGPGSIEIGDSGESAQYTLLPGTNYVGMLTVPNGYSAYNLLTSAGLDNVKSVRRFNNQTGLWETASVREGVSGKEAVGVNFAVRQGDGLIIIMKNRVDGWTP